MIVPKHDLVGWELRVGTASHERQYVASEQHLYDANASLEVYTNQLFEHAYS